MQGTTENSEIVSDLMSEVNTSLSNWGEGFVGGCGHAKLPDNDEHDYFYLEGLDMPRSLDPVHLPEWAEWSCSNDSGPYDHREIIEVDREMWRQSE